MLINNIKQRKVIKAVAKTTALIKITKQTQKSFFSFIICISHVKHTNEKRTIISSNPKYNYNLLYFCRKCYISILILLVLENTPIHQKQMVQKNILIYNQIVIISLQRLQHWAAIAAMFTNNGGIKSVRTGLCFCVHCQKGTVNEFKLFKSKLIWF